MVKFSNPDVVWYLNIGDEDSPTWQEVGANHYFYFTGPDTTTKKDDLTPPTFYNYKWAEELWIAESGFNNPTQCKAFVAPDNITQNANVLRISFNNYSTSSTPILTAYDNSSQSSVSDQIFTGGNGTISTPWLKAIETTGNSQPSQNWITGTDATSNSSVANALSSTTYAVTCATTASANSSKGFALACALPSDATTDTHSWAFSIRYTYN